MATFLEKVRDANRLARMRLGQTIYEPITFESVVDPDTGKPLVFAMVVLTESESQQGVVAASMLDVPENLVGMSARNRVGMINDLWHSLRDPEDLSKKAFESPEQLVDTILPPEVDAATDKLAVMMDYASPSVDGITDEQLEALKKAFSATDWSALSGRQWAAVKLCCHTLLPELMAVVLQGSSSGSTSTESSTETSEGVALISGASQS